MVIYRQAKEHENKKTEVTEMKTAKQAKKEIALTKGCEEKNVYIFNMYEAYNGKTIVEYAIENSGDNEIKEFNF